jgi:hypothetical protein
MLLRVLHQLLKLSQSIMVCAAMTPKLKFGTECDFVPADFDSSISSHIARRLDTSLQRYCCTVL